MHAYSSIAELIGHTPLMELKNIEESLNLNAKIFAKIEYFNPAGSAKDRVALSIITDAERKGTLTKNSTIIEPTSGNTGIGLAALCASKGYKLIIVMPDNMSEERKLLMGIYGAKLVLTPGALGMKGAIEKAEELLKEIPDSFIAGQFDNPANPKAHFETTGPEIYEASDGEVDFFVAGVGTGGTITGTGEYLKSKIPSMKVIAVEPDASRVLEGEPAAAHGLQGIGANFIPSVLNRDIYDEIIHIKDEEAYEAVGMLAQKEGLLTGITSGASLYAGIELAKRKENAGKNIVVLLPDTGDRYLSTLGTVLK